MSRASECKMSVNAAGTGLGSYWREQIKKYLKRSERKRIEGIYFVE